MVKSKTFPNKKSSGDIKSKGHKSKRWKKGHSCATNPETNKNRLAAKARLFSVNSGKKAFEILVLSAGLTPIKGPPFGLVYMVNVIWANLTNDTGLNTTNIRTCTSCLEVICAHEHG